MRYDALYLWFLADVAAPRYVGQLRLVSGAKGVSLEYSKDWIASGFALSDDLGLIDTEQAPRWKNIAVGAVDDARPDGWGQRVIQFLDKPARFSIMEHLFYAGDKRFGALSVSTSALEYLPRETGPLPQLSQAQQLSDIVHKVSSREDVSVDEAKLISPACGLGGAKPKALIENDGVQWLIKFFNNEPIDMPLIEHASMTLAKIAGINVAETKVVRLLCEHALVVRRFDRDGDRRIHCISAGTALRAATMDGNEPVFGYPALAQLLHRSGVEDDGQNVKDMQELFRRMVFNILIDNTDDHEKNHVLMLVSPNEQGRYKLSPAYDVLPTNSGQGYQEFIVGKDLGDSTLTNAMSECHLFGYTLSQAAEVVVKIIDVVSGWRSHFQECGVSDADLDSLAERIDGSYLLDQRKSFKAEEYAG